MMMPSPTNFRRIQGRFFQGVAPKKPRWYKYYWWIYTESTPLLPNDPPYEWMPPAVHATKTRLTTFEAMLKARDLDDHFETYFLYNWQYRRLDPDTPWYNTLMLQGGGAPSYETDPDRPWRGHK